MDETLRGWLARTVISLVPVAVAPATIAFGNPPVEALGEGIAIFVYLLVVLSSENVVLFASQHDESSLVALTWQVMLIILSMVLWMFLVFVRVQARVSSSSLVIFLLGSLTGIAILVSFFILRTHRDVYGQDVALKIRTEGERLEKRVEGKPDEVSLGGKKIDL